jgi:hypothetical protein
VNRLKVENPVRAKEIEENILKKNEFDDVLNEEVDVMSMVKLYPGSEKGPNPEDDPEHYSKWFIENQPKYIYGDEPTDFRDIGAKKRFITSV